VKKWKNHGTLSKKSQNSRRIHGHHLLVLKYLIDIHLFVPCVTNHCNQSLTVFH